MAQPKTCTECNGLTEAFICTTNPDASEFYCTPCAKSYTLTDVVGAYQYWQAANKGVGS